jgi:DNA end-binding protein Ku
MAEVRSSWKGRLKLSLVTAAVRLAPATSETGRIRFNQLNSKTGNRVRQQLIDSETGEEVPREDIVKGYEFSKGRYVEVSDAELDAVRLETTHTIDIERFVDAEEINEIYRNTPYYVMPDGNVADEAYIVMREAMAKAGKAAIGRVTISTREHPALIEPCGKGLLLTTLRPEREVRHAKDYFEDIPDLEIEPDLMEMAETLIEKRLGHFEPKTFVDRYQEALRKLVEAKIEGVEPVQEEEEHRPAKVINLMDALKKSLSAEGVSGPAPAKKRAEQAAPKGKAKASAKAPAKAPAKKAASGGKARRA